MARVALSRMTQDRGEPIRAFAARLRGQAEVCRFTKKCPGCDRISNQGEERVADQLCVGLADAEIQEDLLKHPDQSMSVEDTIRFVEVRAAGKKVSTHDGHTNLHQLHRVRGRRFGCYQQRLSQAAAPPAPSTGTRLEQGNTKPTPCRHQPAETHQR